MHCPGPVRCPDKDIGTPRQTIWLKRASTVSTNNQGRTGWKAKPAAMRNYLMAIAARTYKGRKGGGVT